MKLDRHSIARCAPALLSAVMLALPACQALGPTVHALQEPPQPERDPTQPLVLPAPAERANEEPAPAPEVQKKVVKIGGDEKVRLEFRDTYLAAAIHMLAETAGVNMYLDAGLDRKIDVSFPSVTVDDAMQTILAQNGLEIVEGLPGIYSITLADGSEIVERRFDLKSARVADVDANLKSLAVAGTKVITDAEQNFVVVRGRRSDVDMIAQYLEGADRLKVQVLIEMRIVEVRLGENFEIGLSHALGNVDVGNNLATLMTQFTVPGDQFNLTLQSNDGDLTSTLEALGRYAGVEMLSSPHVVAVNNTEAVIEIIREVPYIQVTTDTTSGTTGGVGTSSTEEVAFKDVGIKLKVTPSIRAGGVIEFRLEQELSEVAEYLNGIPAVDKRSLTSRFEVRDRDTLVIGGLMQDRKGQIDTGIPGLMDIPFLGALFRSKEDSVEKRELLIFFTPRIVAFEESGPVSDRYRKVYGERKREMGLDPNARANTAEETKKP